MYNPNDASKCIACDNSADDPFMPMKNLISKNYWLLIVLGLICVTGILSFSRPASSQATSVKEPPTFSTATSRLGAGALFVGRLSWVGSTPPGEEESQLLLEAMTNWSANPYVAASHLEEFAAQLTNSPWTPTIHAHLGHFYRSRGQITKSLDHWQAAWETTRMVEAGSGKQVADFALANWTRLLMVLGRTDELTAVYEQHGSRTLDRGPMSQMWLRTHEKHLRMTAHPEESYKCGIYALNRVAQALQLRYRRGELLQTPSQPSGFSLQELQEISQRFELGLVAVQRAETSSQIIVPSVVHWRQEHYAAVIAKSGDLFQVTDPSGLGVMWLTADEINVEASGCFMIPEVLANQDFGRLSEAEASLIRGRASSCPPDDYEDVPCETCPCPEGIGPNSNEREGCIPCGNGNGAVKGAMAAPGMPTWRISEPHLNLWLEDVPLHYDPAKGPPVVFKLRYKQRGEMYELWSDVGLNWNCDWVVAAVGFLTQAGYPSSAYIERFGRLYSYSFPAQSYVSEANYRDNTHLEVLVNAGIITGFILHFPDGTQQKFSQGSTYSSLTYFQMSELLDPQGNKLTFNYTADKLTSITDADGNDTTLHYDDQDYPYNITGVTAPGGLEATLNYEDGLLTNIVDAAGISSSVTYDPYGRLNSLTTPYGTTGFENGYGMTIERWAVVTQPDGGKHAYMLTDLNPADMPDGFSSNQIPTNTPFASGSYSSGSLEITNRSRRNTFYWNPQQVTAMGTTNFESFDWSEFKRARIRHWQKRDDSANNNHLDTLGHEQSPSPDGTIEGQITWYDHEGKDFDAPEFRGSQILPAVTARVMPDGSTWFKWEQRNIWGSVTNLIEKWNAGNDALFRTNSFIYDGLDLVLHRGPHGEQVVSNYFNANHQVLASYDALNQETTFTYDGTTRLRTSVTRPSGLITTNLYDGNHRLQQTIDLPINRTNAYTWHSSGNMATHTDERGLTITYYWDALNRPTGTSYPDGTTTTNLYVQGSTKLLDLTAVKNRMGGWNYFGYDSLRRKIAETNANGVVTRYGYCDCGSAAYVTNAWGTAAAFVTTYDYDYQGNQVRIHYPDASVTNWFDSLQRMTITGDAWGYTWYGYDNLNRRTSVTNGLGAVEQSMVYDIDDHPLYVTDANGVTVTNTYDEVHRLKTRAYPDGGMERFGYSARGLTAYTNQLNFVTRYAYDEALRKTFETNANNEVIRYTNNTAGDLLALVDGKNQVTQWKYDEYGRVTNKLDQAGTEILRYKYDPNSQLTNRWSVAKGETKYGYDPVGNLTLVDYPVSPDVTRQYDALNRVTNMVDAAGTTKYAYAAGGQLWTEDGPWSNDTVTNTYSYRMRTGLSLAQLTGRWTNEFGYDAAKRLTSVTSPAGTFTYTLGATAPASPLVQKLALPNTSYITNIYDGNARLLTTSLKNSSHATLNAHAYQLNQGNQRTQQVFSAGSTYNYTYDAIGQLKFADSATANEDRGYAYDGAWNLSYRTNGGSLDAFGVNSRNELGYSYFSATTGFSPTYDASGNLTRWEAGDGFAWHHDYDDENRLVRRCFFYDGNGTPETPATEDDWRSDYWYDGMGRLRQRVDYACLYDAEYETYYWEANDVTYYVYDGMRVIQERTGSSAHIPTVSYTRGTDLSGSLEGAGGIGGLLARSHGYSSGNWSTHNFYHADGNGNVTYLVDSSQGLAASYRYDPYGRTISSSGSLASANGYRFSSKEHFDRGIQSGWMPLYYYGYRWYAPIMQRWVNRDPILERGGINLYGFVANEPISKIDPTGRMGGIIRFIGKGKLKGGLGMNPLCPNQLFGPGECGPCAFVGYSEQPGADPGVGLKGNWICCTCHGGGETGYREKIQTDEPPIGPPAPPGGMRGVTESYLPCSIEKPSNK